MTTITITLPRATVEQALEAMRRAVPTGKITLADWHKSIAELEAVLAQQVKHVAWMRPWPPVRAQQAEPVCPDCRGLGYDSSGQLCGCQDKPSPCAYPNCVGGQAGTICKPSCPGGTK